MSTNETQNHVTLETPIGEVLNLLNIFVAPGVLGRRLASSPELVGAVADAIDLDDLATHVAGEIDHDGIAETLAEKVADGVDPSAIAEHIEARDLAEHIEVDEDAIAESVANNLDLSDLAGQLDAEEIASHIDVDVAQVAATMFRLYGSQLAEMVAAKLDLDRVAQSAIDLAMPRIEVRMIDGVIPRLEATVYTIAVAIDAERRARRWWNRAARWVRNIVTRRAGR